MCILTPFLGGEGRGIKPVYVKAYDLQNALELIISCSFQ